MKRLLFTIIALFFFFSCGDETTSKNNPIQNNSIDQQIKQEPFKISLAPSFSGDIATNANIIFDISVKLKASTIISENIYVQDSSAQVHPTKVIYLNNQIIITPTANYLPNADYSVVLNTNIQDLKDNSLGEDVIIGFHTLSESDTTNPTFKKYFPLNMNAPIQQNFSFVFSENIDPTSVTRDDFNLSYYAGGVITLSDGKAYVFSNVIYFDLNRSDNDLDGVDLTLEINGTILDSAGNAYSGPNLSHSITINPIGYSFISANTKLKARLFHPYKINDLHYDINYFPEHLLVSDEFGFSIYKYSFSHLSGSYSTITQEQRVDLNASVNHINTRYSEDGGLFISVSTDKGAYVYRMDQNKTLTDKILYFPTDARVFKTFIDTEYNSTIDGFDSFIFMAATTDGFYKYKFDENISTLLHHENGNFYDVRVDTDQINIELFNADTKNIIALDATSYLLATLPSAKSDINSSAYFSNNKEYISSGFGGSYLVDDASITLTHTTNALKHFSDVNYYDYPGTYLVGSDNSKGVFKYSTTDTNSTYYTLDFKKSIATTYDGENIIVTDENNVISFIDTVTLDNSLANDVNFDENITVTFKEAVIMSSLGISTYANGDPISISTVYADPDNMQLKFAPPTGGWLGPVSLNFSVKDLFNNDEVPFTNLLAGITGIVGPKFVRVVNDAQNHYIIEFDKPILNYNSILSPAHIIIYDQNNSANTYNMSTFNYNDTNLSFALDVQIADANYTIEINSGSEFIVKDSYSNQINEADRKFSFSYSNPGW